MDLETYALIIVILLLVLVFLLVLILPLLVYVSVMRDHVSDQERRWVYSERAIVSKPLPRPPPLPLLPRAVSLGRVAAGQRPRRILGGPAGSRQDRIQVPPDSEHRMVSSVRKTISG